MLEHGGRLREAALRYGIAESDWLDLSTGIAPWSVRLPEIPASAWMRLPEVEDGLEAAACAYYGAGQVLPVPGSQAAIQLLPRLRQANSRVGVLVPCYAEHGEAWRRGGHRVGELMVGEVERRLDDLDVLVLANPNNPDGRLLEPTLLLDWRDRLAQRGGWLVVDEAFMDASPELSLAGHAGLPGLILLRSFGKFFGLAGARLGFVLGEARVLDLLAEQLGPWAVSGPARALGKACLVDSAGQQAQRRCLLQAGRRLAELLADHDLPPQGGCALFQWIADSRAEALHEFLAGQGILTRLFRQPLGLRFGLPADELAWVRLEQALAAFPEITR
jgi:cobalamin biosynthetic protein CobC